jgi:hypothetical protein
MKRLIPILWIPLIVHAQTTINGGRIFKGTLDASGATSTVPYRTGTGSPAGRDNCSKVGETYFQTDAIAGQNVWACVASGTPGNWAQFSVTNAAQTNISNSFTAGTQDFSRATHTLPAKVGNTANKPSTCTTGEMYFAIDAMAGQNWYYCTSTNIWSAQTGGVSDPGSNGIMARTGIASSTARVLAAGPGITVINGDGVNGNPTVSMNTAIGLTNANAQANKPWFCNSKTGSTIAYACTLSAAAALTSYTIGLCVDLWVDRSNTGAATLNIDSLGAQPIKIGDGVTDPLPNQIGAGRETRICYDGTSFRLPTAIPLAAISLDGSAQGTYSAFNFQTPAGLNWQLTPNGQTLNLTQQIDTAVVPGKQTANTYAPGAKQSVSPGTTSAGINIGSGLIPSIPVTGDLAIDPSGNFNWYDGTAWRLPTIADAALPAGAPVVGNGTNHVTTGNTTGTGNFVLSTTPTISNPVITSFINANHDHSNSANGGRLSVNAFNGGLGASTATYLRGDGTWATPPGGGGGGGGGSSITSPTSSINNDVVTFSGTAGNAIQDAGISSADIVTSAATYISSDLIQAAGSNKTTSDSGIPVSNVVTSVANYISNDLIQAAGNNKTTVDSGILVSNVVTSAANYITNDLIQAASNNKTTVDSGIPVSSVVTSAVNYTASDLIQAAGNDRTTVDSGLSVASVVTSAANYTLNNLVQAAGNNRSTSDSGVAVANVVTASANYTANHLIQAAGSNKATSDSGIAVSSLITTSTAAGGDLSGNYRTPTVAKINGTSVPANTAADQIINTTASATGQWTSMPSCQDSAGNHLNYDTTTHAFSCGRTSSGGGGSGATMNQNIRDVAISFDGGGSALSGTITRCRVLDFGGTIQQISIVGDLTGNGVFKVLSVPYASYAGPSSASDISNGGETVAGAYKLQDATLTGWTTALTSGTILCGQLSSASVGTWWAVTVQVAAN